MFPAITPNEMRQVVLSGFQRHRRRRLESAELDERVRVEDGRVVAYCYRAGNLFAMWLVQVGLVQFYDGAGNMLQTVDLISPAATDRRAA